MKSLQKFKGLLIGLFIIVLWFSSLLYLLNFKIDFSNPILILFILVQTHLYTGLFITAHDAIHGVVVPDNKPFNYLIGFLCATLFAFNYYPKLERKHHHHHQFVVSDADPDYHTGGFWSWYFKFLKEYITIGQIVCMAITYNLLKLVFPMENLIVFWMIPAVLSTFQLFYFGTYIPHRGEHQENDIYKARSQKLNHFLAFISCYFFGYHHEHHAQPYLPWWKLAGAREKNG
ncbi:MAG: fatty acid desaturase [Bacteroidota bacterium]